MSLFKHTLRLLKNYLTRVALEPQILEESSVYLTHFLPTFLKQWFSLLIDIDMLTLRVGELTDNIPFLCSRHQSACLCIDIIGGWNSELVNSPGKGAKTLQWRSSKICLAFSNDREKTITIWLRDLNKSKQILGGKINEHVFSDALKSNLFSKIHPLIRHWKHDSEWQF